MNNNTSIAIFFGTLFLCMGGCCTMKEYQEGLTAREMEKTRQMQIQAKIDSIQAVNKHL